MKKPKLTYFDLSASRGEECRLALAIAGVDFEDERLNREQWLALKAKTPYGKLPLLTIGDRPPLAQTNAILGFIARGHDLCPKDSWELARHDGLMTAADELRSLVGTALHIKDDAERKAAREALAEGPMQEWAAQVEAQLQGPYAMGEKLCVADVKLFAVYNWFAAGIVDHIPKDVFSRYPKLSKIYELVGQDDRVVTWRTSQRVLGA